MVKSKSPHGVGDMDVSRSEAAATEGRIAQVAHDLEDVSVVRTDDILNTDDTEFKSLLLPDFILNGLTAAKFYKPSPIQLRSIPLLRLGLDLIVQSKAGTGKTLVITLAALESMKFDSKRLQVLVLAPTREIALQTKYVITLVSSDVTVRTEVFIGGTSVKDDKKKLLGCQIAIGTPGRLNSLIESGDMLLGHVKLFVLDEADKLMEESIFSQVKSISKLLPPNKQTILCSATFLHPVRSYVVKHMKEPFWVTPEAATRFQASGSEHHKTTSSVLLGVTQFVKEVPNHPQIVRKLRYKLEEILEILSGHSFTQCIIFSNYQSRAETICHQLVSNGWPAMSVRGRDEQSHRTATLNSFKELGCRVLLTTDVMSRGVDFRGVDLVINLDIPYDSSTYLHRMGRAGRFGSYGCVITLASEGEEVDNLKKILSEISDSTVYMLPSEMNLIKIEKQLLTVYFGPSEDSVYEGQKREEPVKTVIKEEENLESEDFVAPDVNRELVFCKNERKDGEQKLFKVEIQDNLSKDETKDISRSFSLMKLDHKLATASAAISSSETHKDKVIQEANAHLSRALCGPKLKSTKFHSFQELENSLSVWTDDNHTDKCEASLTHDTEKHVDWWTSANIVLTAAELQLQDLREKAQMQADKCSSVDSDFVHSSSESASNYQLKDDSQFSRKKHARSKPKSSKAYATVKSTRSKKQSRCNDDASRENSSWLWDETSNLYYVWDDSNNCYHLYNPCTEKYFKWDVGSNRYFEWDSASQNYKVWKSESECCCDSSSCQNNTSPSIALAQNADNGGSTNHEYFSWFTLWNKHLQQMTWQVYQAEYIKHLVDKYHHK